jgi:Tfp pilus assembly protein FimT
MKKNNGVTLLELVIVLAITMVVVGAVFIGARVNNNDYRALQNAAVMIQADLRYAQRRAVMEGQRFGVHFEPHHNRYHIVTMNPVVFHRTVNLHGVNLRETNYPNNRVMYLPRGTAIPGTIVLTNGNFRQEITTTLSGGQVRIHNIEEVY